MFRYVAVDCSFHNNNMVTPIYTKITMGIIPLAIITYAAHGSLIFEQYTMCEMIIM